MSVISDNSEIELEVGAILGKTPEVDEDAVHKYVENELKLSYQDLDIKGRGGLTAEDIRAAYATMGIPITLEECSWVVEEMDTTGEGVIDFNDFSTAMYSEYDRCTTEEEMAMFFNSMDIMSDGFVDIGDIQIAFQKCGIKMSITEAAAIMSDADDNSNAAIDFEEFKSYCRRIDGYSKLTEPKKNLGEEEAEKVGFKTVTVDPSVLEKKTELDDVRKALLGLLKDVEEKNETSVENGDGNPDSMEEKKDAISVEKVVSSDERKDERKEQQSMGQVDNISDETVEKKDDVEIEPRREKQKKDAKIDDVTKITEREEISVEINDVPKRTDRDEIAQNEKQKDMNDKEKDTGVENDRIVTHENIDAGKSLNDSEEIQNKESEISKKDKAASDKETVLDLPVEQDGRQEGGDPVENGDNIEKEATETQNDNTIEKRETDDDLFVPRSNTSS